jgi:hypothetical protein
MNLTKKLEQEIADSQEMIWDNDEKKDMEGIRCTQDIIDYVMNRQDSSLDFEVGYLKGIERAMELIGDDSRIIPKFDRSADHGAHNCMQHGYCEVCGLKL